MLCLLQKCDLKKQNFINKTMKNCSGEKIALIATQIAIEISKGKNIAELNLIKSVVGQISCTLQTIITKRLCEDVPPEKK